MPTGPDHGFVAIRRKQLVTKVFFDSSEKIPQEARLSPFRRVYPPASERRNSDAFDTQSRRNISPLVAQSTGERSVVRVYRRLLSSDADDQAARTRAKVKTRLTPRRPVPLRTDGERKWSATPTRQPRRQPRSGARRGLSCPSTSACACAPRCCSTRTSPTRC